MIAAFLVLLVGCFFYARTGVITTMILFVGYITIMIRENDVKLLAIPVVIFLFVMGMYLLVNRNEIVARWYDWGFAQIIMYQKTGSFQTESTADLMDMYTRWPQGLGWLAGDGRYIGDRGGYYQNVDPGWLRSLFNYGLFFSFIQYTALAVLIHDFVLRLRLLIEPERKMIKALLWMLFLVFETKGEVWYMMFSVLLPLCLINEGERINITQNEIIVTLEDEYEEIGG